MQTEELKKLILKLCGHKEFYGYEVHKVLASEGVELGISRLYRVLNGMMKQGLLEGNWKKSHRGPQKRMYRLGEQGKAALDEILVDAIKTVHSFYGAYLRSLIPKINVFEEIYQFLTNELKGTETIVFVTRDFSPMHELIIRNLHMKLPRGKIFIVKPTSLAVDVNLDTLLFLDGYYDDIPLKTNYADCMIVIALPKDERLDSTLKEWHRVIKPNGMIAVLTPTILLEKYEDPLTIGDFIEKYEHETIEKGEHFDRAILEARVKRYFKMMDEKSLVHMTTLRFTDPI
ncbi:MAG: helix-turn-helix transcriptional regulator [Candidatus Bathyarchaeota archaeon]|nr:MAG: helix-turn-helix transcriptional regulator [Candidatus Bathyarchaeota archaeon]